jgi:ACS family hexuronate transporter-like MFS transporter
MLVSSERDSAPSLQTQPAGHYRWVICGLLFLATTINYIDRAVIGILKPTLMENLGWSETDFADIMSWFSLAYAFGYGLAGRLIDWTGVRVGYAVAVFFWSLAAMGHGLVRSVVGFSMMRAALGLAEGGNFPAAVKSASEWFPRRERALAVGLFNSGSNIGVVVAPIIVPWLTMNYQWPAAFYVTGALGFAWLTLWWIVYDSPQRHASVTPSELAYIESDPQDPPVKVPWLDLLAHRQTWVFIVGMSLSSPIWWFYLFWAAGFFHDKFGIDLKGLGLPLVTVYLMADFGSIGGGWLSGRLIKRGWTVNAARKTAMLVCALCVTPVFAAALVDNAWIAILLIGLAATAHQGFSANLYTLVSDMAPRNVISSIVGLGGMAAGFAAVGFQRMTGRILDAQPNGYLVILIVASCSYLVNLMLIHAIVPRLEPMVLAERQVS